MFSCGCAEWGTLFLLITLRVCLVEGRSRGRLVNMLPEHAENEFFLTWQPVTHRVDSSESHSGVTVSHQCHQ